MKQMLWGRVASSLWVLPALFTVGAVLLALTTLWLDRAFEDTNVFLWSFPGDDISARSLLSTIAAAMINFLALVFTITIVVLQLVSNRFTPRVLRTFLQDRVSQVALATFVATFTYAVVVLRTVGGHDSGGSFVPTLSTTVAFLLVLASVAVFVRYIDHMARSIRISHITTAVGRDTEKALERHYPADREEEDAPDMPPHPDAVVVSKGKGVVVALDEDELTRWARESGGAVRVLRRVGEFVARGSPLVEIFGASETDELGQHVHLAEERELSNDPAFGFRQLVDVAERALSPGTVDPTTAVQALDQLHDLLRDLCHRPAPGTRLLRDDDGVVRVIVPQRTWSDFLDLTVDEIAFHGRESLQVQNRIRNMLDDVASVTSPERRGTIEAKRRDVVRLWGGDEQ